MPLYARGYSQDRKIGHAWVIDGVKEVYTTTQYTLYRLLDTQYPNFVYGSAENASPWISYAGYLKMYHMNWGFGGSGNGWYPDTNIKAWITVDGESSIRDYCDQRHELIISKP